VNRASLFISLKPLAERGGLSAQAVANHNGRKYRMLNVLDEFTHECLAIRGRKSTIFRAAVLLRPPCRTCGLAARPAEPVGVAQPATRRMQAPARSVWA
jgi:hypothetical protein